MKSYLCEYCRSEILIPGDYEHGLYYCPICQCLGHKYKLVRTLFYEFLLSNPSISMDNLKYVRDIKMVRMGLLK